MTDAYWSLVVDDVEQACAVLRPTFDASDGDRWLRLDRSRARTRARHRRQRSLAARELHRRIAQPNLFVKIPATAEGIPAIRSMTAEGRSINITLIFSLTRYAEVIEAYLAGLETFAASGGDLSRVRSVASFFVSRVDSEVDRRLDTIGTDEANDLRGHAAIAQAKLAYQDCSATVSAVNGGNELARHGARPQRPLWASTSTKNPAYRDTLYVESLIGPDTVNTLPEATIAAFEDHGVLARTVDADVDAAQRCDAAPRRGRRRYGRCRAHPREGGHRELPHVVPGGARITRR